MRELIFTVRATLDEWLRIRWSSLTFFEAWRMRHRLRPDGDSVLPWLLGIATNVLRNLRRTMRRHRAAMERLPEQRVPDHADDVVGRIQEIEQLAAAKAALTRLRQPYRDVFTLCVWSGLDYASAAEALGIPIGTVRSRLSRARDRLRALAEDELTKRRTAVENRIPTTQPIHGRDR